MTDISNSKYRFICGNKFTIKTSDISIRSDDWWACLSDHKVFISRTCLGLVLNKKNWCRNSGTFISSLSFLQQKIMCTGKCSTFIGISLYPLAILSIICNVVLFFPDLKSTYAEQDSNGLYRLTDEVKYMGGVIGGGILVSDN